MSPALSIIIPVRNGEASIAQCLSAIGRGHEVVVVDDASTDRTAEIAREFPVKLITLGRQAGASGARNAGARAATGKVLLFIDADCVMREDTLERALEAYGKTPETIIGGTYTALPYDKDFYSRFQSAFVHHYETRAMDAPDYIATHLMVVGRDVFERTGGFEENFMPIIEDVEFSHRARGLGIKLRMEPGLEIRHMFNFSLSRSIRNAYRKARYWTEYSIKAGDMHRDSGTASIGLKANGAAWATSLLAAGLMAITVSPIPLAAALVAECANIYINRKFLRMLMGMGAWFGLRASAYYIFIYPAPVIAGGLRGLAGRG